jgi:hypothetical protein
MHLTYRHVAAFGLSLTVVGGAALAAPTAPKNNGTWSVRMVTDSGICDRSYDYAIAVQNGNVRYLPTPGDSPTTVSGRIGPDGNVDLDIHRSIARVHAFGRLDEKSGSGTWRLGMLGCSGRWIASKQTRTVQN